MSENLSQSQIDALFQAKDEGKEALSELLTSTKEEQGRFKEYDFLQPDKFNLDNTNSLKQIAKLLGRNLSQTLTARLRLSSPLVVELNKENGIEQVPYATEYVEKMPKDHFVFIEIELGAKDLGKIILQMDLAMVIPLHRKSTGAPKIQIEEERKPLSYLERVALKSWVKSYVLKNMEEAFQSIVDTNMEIKQIEMDPQQVQITTSNDMVALVMYDVWLDDDPSRKTTMFLCIPYLSIEPIIEKLTTENVHEFKLKYEDRQNKETIKRNLELVQKKVHVELGKTKLTLRELLTLGVNDVLPLSKEVGEELTGYIENKPKFSCLPGKDGNKIAVKITGFAQKGGDTNG